MPESPLRFAAIGLNHPHVCAQVAALKRAGAELAAFYAAEPELARGFGQLFPEATSASGEAQILQDERVAIVVCAAIPSERAGIAIRAMRHGKDVLVDKPGVTTPSQLAEVRDAVAQTGRIFSVFFSERFESRATLRAAELVHSGAIGQVVQIVGFGPHRANLAQRPDWFFRRERYGGILCDIASHQIDQFLHFASADGADISQALVANYAHPEHPEFEDYGELHLQTPRTTGTLRVDWFTADGLPTWGDGRLFVLGTEGSLEVRKYCDVAGRPGADHLFLVDAREARRIECDEGELPFARQFLTDVRERSESAMTQRHCFTVCELALRAQAQATRRGHLA